MGDGWGGGNKMKWGELLQHYEDWSEKTVLSKIASLEDIGPFDEVEEFLNFFGSQEIGDAFVKKAHELGAVFTKSQIAKLDEVLSEDTLLEEMLQALRNGDVLSYEELYDLSYYLDEPALETLLDDTLKKGAVFKPEQIMEFESLVDEMWMAAMVNQYMRGGGIFTPAQILEFEGLVDEKTMTAMALRWNGSFSKSDIEDLEGLIDDAALHELDRKNNTHYFDDDDEEGDDDWDDEDDPSYDYADTSGEKPGFFSRLFGLGAANKVVNGGDGPISPGLFSVGMHVRVLISGQEGTIIDVIEGPPRMYMVSLDDGSKVDVYYEENLTF